MPGLASGPVIRVLFTSVMPIETINLSEPKFQNYLRNNGWVLCVGAGICRGILPDWFELTRNLVNSSFTKNWTSTEFKAITDETGFSLDSWIQGCLNKLKSDGKSLDDFNKLLEGCLYKSLLESADKQNLKKELVKLFEEPKALAKNQVLNLCTFFEKNYSDTTLLQIVFALVKPKAKAQLPSAIITFNADSLIHSLIVIFSIKNEYESTAVYSQPAEPFRKVTRTFQRWHGSIPIFHLHGSISPDLKINGKQKRDSRDSLIFLENSYNDVANNMYSWAQTTFLYSAQNSRLVFIGLSMSDPNIRRWLSWTNQKYSNELDVISDGNGKSLPHLWIRTKAKSNGLQDFLDVSLHHMGVKIGLIDDWNKIGETITKIM